MSYIEFMRDLCGDMCMDTEKCNLCNKEPATPGGTKCPKCYKKGIFKLWIAAFVGIFTCLYIMNKDINFYPRWTAYIMLPIYGVPLLVVHFMESACLNKKVTAEDFLMCLFAGGIISVFGALGIMFIVYIAQLLWS